MSDAIAHGDLPGISYVIVDGEIIVGGRSRQTPPPNRQTFFSCCEAHSGFGLRLTFTAERPKRSPPARAVTFVFPYRFRR